MPDSVIGNTTDSDSVILGSSPSRAARITPICKGADWQETIDAKTAEHEEVDAAIERVDQALAQRTKG